MFQPHRPLALAVCLLAAVLPTQSRAERNVFSGFEFVLFPLGVKWYCGGDPHQDLSALDVLIAAFPEDAEDASLQRSIDVFLEMSKRETGLSELLQNMVRGDLSAQHVEELCAAALRLNIVWLTPEMVSRGADPDNDPEQKAAIEAFYSVLERLQRANPP